jgi:isocitrate dehydrogenase
VLSFVCSVFEKYSTLFTELNIDTRNGLGDVYAKLQVIQQTEVETAINQAIENGPGLAMVNSDKELQTFTFLQMLL